MRIALTLFALLLGMVGVLAWTVTLEAPANATGFQHPDQAAMLQGGDLSRHDNLFGPSLTLGVLEIVFFLMLMALAVQHRDRIGSFAGPLAVCGAIYVGFFVAMFAAYRHYGATESPALYLSFPATTALMLFGVGGAPLLLIALYIARFEQWILTPEDRERYEELLKANEGGD